MTDGSGNQLQHATSASDSTVPIPEPSFSDAPAPEPSSSLFLSTNAIYFGAHYLATILAVLLSLLWRIIDTDLRRLEPFYQLSQPTGTSLTENLLFTSIFVLPIHAVRRRQWSVLLSTMIYCPLLTLVQILAASAVFLATPEVCDPFAPTRTCGDPYVATRHSVARMLEVALGCVVFAILAIIWFQSKRKCLLRAEPWSIAGLATLLADGTVVEGDEGLADGYKYRLVEWTHNGDSFLALESVRDAEPNTVISHTKPAHIESWKVTTFTLLMCGVLTLILVYRFTTYSAIEPFMSGQSVWVNLPFIALGITIRCGWEPIEREARHLEVFHRLLQRYQPLSTLLTDEPRSFPIVSQISALIHGRIFIAALGMVGLLVEALVVPLTGIPYSGTQTWLDFNVSMFLSVSILIIAIIMVGVFMFRRRGIEKKMPHVPYTIAGIKGYLYAARMLDGFSGLSTLSCNDRLTIVKDMGKGKRYGLGWTVGIDGKKRVGVDEEMLLGDYRR